LSSLQFQLQYKLTVAYEQACSLDKIRPEKELERAKAEILRCKLRIREVFQNLDSLLSKGKIDESLFDSEGEISCEDVWYHVILIPSMCLYSLIMVFCYAQYFNQ
jgi:hypothetical protein